MDRLPGFYGTGNACATRTGCFTFFARQGSGDPTWMNAGEAAFHGATLSIRRAFSSGVSFDFNYTLSHSIDNGSAAEGAAGSQGASLQNIYNEGQFRGSSDFDIRHNINANVIYQLPLGKGKLLLRNSSRLVRRDCRRVADLQHHSVSQRPAVGDSRNATPGTPTTTLARSRSRSRHLKSSRESIRMGFRVCSPHLTPSMRSAISIPAGPGPERWCGWPA